LGGGFFELFGSDLWEEVETMVVDVQLVVKTHADYSLLYPLLQFVLHIPIYTVVHPFP
jgi:hypothetical protein